MYYVQEVVGGWIVVSEKGYKSDVFRNIDYAQTVADIKNDREKYDPTKPKTVTVNKKLYNNLLDLESFVRDCCMTGDLESEGQIAPMSTTDERTIEEVMVENDLLREADER